MGKLFYTPPRIDARALGALCDSCPIKEPSPIGPQLHQGAVLTVLCESPGWTELKSGIPLTGPTGRWFDYAAAKSGIAREQLNILNSTACPMPKGFGLGARSKMVECCAPLLAHFMDLTTPRVVMACGQGACKAMINDHRVTRHVGTWTKGVGHYSEFDVLPNFHPTFAGLRKRTLRVHFLTWLRRAYKATERGVPSWSWSKHTIGVKRGTEPALRRILKRHRPIALDIESVGANPVDCRVTWVGVSDGIEAVSLPWENAKSKLYGNTKHLLEYSKGKALQALMLKVLTSAPYLVTQNGSHDILGMKRWANLENGFDTLRAFSAAAPQTQGYRDLESLAMLEFDGCPRWKTAHRNARIRTDEEVGEYNCCDADATIWLEEPIRRRLHATYRGMELYNRLMAQDTIATKSREVGCLIDTARVAVHEKKLKTRAYEETRNLRRIAARFGMFKFNPESNPQRAELFFRKLGARPTSYSEKTGLPSLDESALNKMMSDPSPDVRRAALHMRRYRGYAQLRKILRSLRTTECSCAICKLAHMKGEAPPHSILRPEANVDGTVGERWSYKSPNIQTIPRPKLERRPDGTLQVLAAGLRNIFVAHPGKWIVELDYDRLELYVVGVLAQDPIILRWMQSSDIDAHSENAMAFFGSVDKALRQLAKTAVYNINYGNTDLKRLAKGLYETIKADFPSITFQTVLHIVRTWFKVHPWVAAWRARELKRAQELGYTEEAVSGRRRYWYGEPKDTEVYNFPIQTLAGHLTARAIISLDAQLDWDIETLLFQCHDSLVLEGPDPVRLYRLAREAMEAPIEIMGRMYSFPVGAKVGRDWGNAVECKDEAAITKYMEENT